MILGRVECDLDEGLENHGVFRRDDQQSLEMLRRAFGVPARLSEFHQRKPCAALGGGAVSYTHLTLPTIYSV